MGFHIMSSARSKNNSPTKVTPDTARNVPKSDISRGCQYHGTQQSSCCQTEQRDDKLRSPASAMNRDCYEELSETANTDHSESFSSNYSDEPSNHSKSRVRFGGVHIHEHPVALGGSGVPRAGAPITLQWKAKEHHDLDSVEEYDDLKSRLRHGDELLMSKSQRIEFLLEQGYTMREIQEESNGSTFVRHQRSLSSRPTFMERIRHLGHRSSNSLPKVDA
eukprot:Nitzschia sp. Nitz4//scaffold28_size193895//110805//111556//NITZ4_001665-RA/size193895-augustus-gene-0.294-mRNA-1//1//CDS//3329545982//7650//frame0